MAEGSPWERLGEEGPGAGGAAHDRWQSICEKNVWSFSASPIGPRCARTIPSRRAFRPLALLMREAAPCPLPC